MLELIRPSKYIAATTAGIVALNVVLATQAPADPFEFFRPAITLSLDQRRAIDRGEVLARVLPGRDREVAIFAAVRVAVDGDRLAAWVRRIDALKRSSLVASIGRFSTPPRLEDLDALTLDDGDLNAIRRCRPGDCGLKLSAQEIGELQRAMGDTRTDWRSRVQEAFRYVILQRVETYLAGGHRALPPYSDRDHPVSLQDAFSALIRRSAYLTERLPRFADYLDRYPDVSLPEGESFVYWSKERLAGPLVISATHVSILRPGDSPLPEVLVAGKQVFATHHMNASLNLTAVLRGALGSPNYLVYLNRSDADALGGLFGGLVRMVAERRVKAEAAEVLQGLARRLESGEPPR